MGCGFSTEDTKASDEERILKASDGVTGKAETTVQVILFEIDCAFFYTNLHELLNKLGKFWFYGQLLNIMSSHG